MMMMKGGGVDLLAVYQEGMTGALKACLAANVATSARSQRRRTPDMKCCWCPVFKARARVIIIIIIMIF
eukprot:12427329-Karenia_brevis.AAC.1